MLVSYAIPPAFCLWIDRVGQTASVSEKEGDLCFACDTEAHRKAVIRALRAQGYKSIP